MCSIMAGWQLAEYSTAAKFKTCQGKGGIASGLNNSSARQRFKFENLNKKKKDVRYETLPSMPVNLKGLGHYMDSRRITKELLVLVIVESELAHQLRCSCSASPS